MNQKKIAERVARDVVAANELDVQAYLADAYLKAGRDAYGELKKGKPKGTIWTTPKERNRNNGTFAWKWLIEGYTRSDFEASAEVAIVMYSDGDVFASVYATRPDWGGRRTQILDERTKFVIPLGKMRSAIESVFGLGKGSWPRVAKSVMAKSIVAENLLGYVSLDEKKLTNDLMVALKRYTKGKSRGNTISWEQKRTDGYNPDEMIKCTIKIEKAMLAGRGASSVAVLYEMRREKEDGSASIQSDNVMVEIMDSGGVLKLANAIYFDARNFISG